MDTNILIQIILVIIEFVIVIIMLISVILVYRTIKSNEDLNRKILFSNVTKEERELRIKLQEYRETIDDKKLKKGIREIATFNYETLLFNYYEYLAICLYKNLINESETKLYFKDLLVSVKRYFDSSLLFEKGAAQKGEYKGIQWLFKKWNI